MIKKLIYVAAAMIMLMASSCSDSKSYADLLTDERKAVNYFLSGYRVIDEIPAGNKFETGADAPFYRMDDDGNVYMQVISAGTADNKAESDQQIYFRFTRYNLRVFETSRCATLDEAIASGQVTGEGNANNLSYGATWFRYGNIQDNNSAKYGSAIQLPLGYFGLDCEVNLVVKSQLGFSDEIASVIPYMYNLRYFPAVSN